MTPQRPQAASSRRSRAANTLLALAMLASAAVSPGQTPAAPRPQAGFHSLPPAWAGDWDGVESLDDPPASAKGLKDQPPHDAADPMVKSLLTPWGQAKMAATSYDDAPGSLCDPEGWFPFINYGYGFALLASPEKITMVPVEADTEGIRRVYLQPAHPKDFVPTWNGHSIARWEGDTLVIDTVGFNDLSWLGDDREPHTTALHLVERLDLVREGKFLRVESEISDPKALTSPYKLTRYFIKYNASHLGAGPDRNMVELVCNEDLSPFTRQDNKANPAPAPPR